MSPGLEGSAEGGEMDVVGRAGHASDGGTLGVDDENVGLAGGATEGFDQVAFEVE